jgi:hypothetical protein
MYQPVSPREVVEGVEHIYGLCQNLAASADERTGAQYARMLFLRRLINNLKHERSGLSPRILAELSRHVPLSIGGSFRLVGYQLDAMREADFLLNGHRTRIIESYPFHLDREIDLPRMLSERDVLERNAFISEVVPDWQKGLPIRVTHKPAWHRRGIFYVQLGTEDNASNRRVRTRTHGGVAGVSGQPLPLCRSCRPVSRNLMEEGLDNRILARFTLLIRCWL